MARGTSLFRVVKQQKVDPDNKILETIYVVEEKCRSYGVRNQWRNVRNFNNKEEALYFAKKCEYESQIVIKREIIDVDLK